MKETAKSLRLYFIIVGLLSGGFAANTLSSSPGITALVSSSVSLVLALAFLGVGIALPKLLKGSILPIVVLLAVNGLLSLLSCVFALMVGGIFAAGTSAVGVIISAYLYANTKRLAKQAHAGAAAT